jgi:uncharacterized protein YwqG
VKLINTEIWGLRFGIKGKKICFSVLSTNGKNKDFWSELSEETLKFLENIIEEHYQEIEEESIMTPQQLEEKYKETLGS